MRLLITGGAGFIGSHFTDWRLKKYPRQPVVVLDKLTYAGNPANLAAARRHANYFFVKADICDAAAVARVIRRHHIDTIANFAAETHVDRSIINAADFVRTDVLGTQTLLEAVRRQGLRRYLQISTDEVYGSIQRGAFRETDGLNPSSPYAASKAGGDLQVLAYSRTYGLPVVITRSSNNYGPRQYPEKLISLFATNALENQPLPLYGDGLHERDWIYVEDNCRALDLVLEKGRSGEIYNIGAGETRSNLEITGKLLSILGKPAGLIRRVPDRPGHDQRYALHTGKIRALGWEPRWKFSDGLRATIQWYAENSQWWRPLKSGEYLKYYQRQYARHSAVRRTGAKAPAAG